MPAGGQLTRQDTCDGDSGGPLVLKRPGKRDLLVGITSYGVTDVCGAANGDNIGVRRAAGGRGRGGGSAAGAVASSSSSRELWEMPALLCLLTLRSHPLHVTSPVAGVHVCRQPPDQLLAAQDVRCKPGLMAGCLASHLQGMTSSTRVDRACQSQGGRSTCSMLAQNSCHALKASIVCPFSDQTSLPNCFAMPHSHLLAIWPRLV